MLFFASIADFGDDLLAQHFAAVIEHFNQAGAGRAGVSHDRSQFGAGEQADNLPLVLSGLYPELVLLPLGHATSASVSYLHGFGPDNVREGINSNSA
jgi:hypothetical protein